MEVSPYAYAPGGDRALTRVYLFQYADETESFHSRLQNIQVCGRDWDGEYQVRLGDDKQIL